MKLNQPAELHRFLSSSWCLCARFHSHSCAKANLLSALVFLTGYPAEARGPWSAEGLPIAALPCLPAGLRSEFTATVKTSVSSQKERGDRGRKRAREQYGTFSPLSPSTDARTCSLSNPEGFWNQPLVNSCFMEARWKNAWQTLEWRHQSSVLSSKENLVCTLLQHKNLLHFHFVSIVCHK